MNEDATPVEIVAPTPIPVVVKESTRPLGPPRQNQNIDPSKPADTTFQQDLMSAGQRNINLLWETTQGNVAVYVILGTMCINGITIIAAIILNREISATIAFALGFVNSLATGVISFYFSRTNHTQVGGVGPKEPEWGDARR